MFTGIIEEVGEILDVKKGTVSGSLKIRGSAVTAGSKVGDSIAVNGVCLTATTIDGDIFTADVMAETMRRTALGSLHAGSKVNLERAMAADGRFGGHMVSGHIDGTGTVRELKKEENATWVTIDADKKILDLIVEKGSIAIDGISLTVAYVDERCFKVSIIPHTGSATTLLDKHPGDTVNLENDIVGKYVQKLLSVKEDQKKSGGVSMELLAKNGFL